MKKIVVKLDLHDEKDKRKVMKTVSAISGVDSITMDMKEKKLTVIGDVDPVPVASKLRKPWRSEILFVGPAKEEKKEEPKKEAKKEEPKKEEKKEPKKEEKEEDPKKEEEKKKKEAETQIAELVNAYKAYNPQYTTHYFVRSVEENPNACVIC